MCCPGIVETEFHGPEGLDLPGMVMSAGDVGAKIVLYAAQGLSNEEIASRLDLPRQVVSKWRKRSYEEGMPGLAERPRRGRPAVFSPIGSG